jgi:PKD repeat protein
MTKCCAANSFFNHLFIILASLNQKMKKLLSFLIISFYITQLFGQIPTSQFTANPLTICEGESVTFTSTSTANGTSPIASYLWDFGDGSIGSGQTVTHVYTSAGNKNITLTVVNAAGISDFEYKPNYISVKPTPDADFSISGIGCNIPLTLNFNNLSTGGSTYSWIFGNGQTSTSVNPPAQTYSTAGSFNTILTVTSANGCVAKDTQEVVVSNYQTSISVPSVACVGQPVTFEDNSTAGVNAWNWNVNGVGTSNQQNPTFTFNNSGTYTILLSSQNTNSGCSGNSSAEITIEPTPIPSFSADPTANCAPAIINFTNTSFGGASYLWNFGDGQTFTGQNPGSHTYYLNGSYDVTLTMVTATGCSGTTTLEDLIEITDVQALFNASVTGGCNPLIVSFIDSSITPSANNPIVSWNWSFGNGQTFNGQNPPAQTYTNGIYDVSLTVQTQSGCIATITRENFITVGEINSLNFSVDTLVNCIKTDFEFSSTVVTTPIVTDSTELNYFWDFTDGNSTEPNPNYQFTSDTGYFDVQLVVDFRGCKDTLQIDSLIYINAPIAEFTPDETLFCNPNSLPISANMTDDATHGETSDDLLMIWKWGDGSPNTVLDDPQLDDGDLGNTSHIYANYGSYTIEQVIYNYTTGCKDSTTRTVDVSTVTPAFSMSNDSICQGDTLFLFDQSSTWLNPPSPHPFESWSFNMGNGSTITGDTTSYSYNSPNLYNVTLTVTNSVGCSATATRQVRVLSNPFPFVSIDNDSICINDQVIFTNNSISISGVPLSTFEYFFYDDSSLISTNNQNPISHIFTENGIYYTDITVIDAFGCQGIQSIPVNIIKPSSFFTVENVICNNDSIFTENSSSGIEPLSYQWILDGTPISTNENAETVISESNLNVGVTSNIHIISLVTTDGSGCTDTVSSSVTVSIPWALPTYTFSGSSIGPNGMYICPPLTGAYLDSSISYGQITNWSWDFGDGDGSSSQNPSNSYVFPGYYTLTLEVTDSYGCVADTILTDYVSIGGPSGDPDWIQQSGQCSQGAQFIIQNAQNIDSTYWVMGDNQIITDSVDFFYNYSESGTYTPGVYLYDDAGCEVFYPMNSITVIDDGLDASFTASPIPAEQNEIITFVDGSVSAASTVEIWEWDFEIDTALAFSNASQQFSYDIAGTYTVTLTVTDALGCKDSYSTNIQIKDPELWLPNVITANNDGINELFVLPFDAFKEYSVTILNRWGNVMRIGQRDPANPLFLWDGTDQSGNLCKDGVYFYQIKGEMFGGTMVDKHGFVTVIESK